MNLEQLRKQAKELVKSARAGDPAALERLAGREPILAHAQLVLAREHGYPSWPALVAGADASVETFVRAATERHRTRAERVLSARPELERDAWVRLVLGRGWEGDPNAPGGPLGWAPLVYACHSVFDTTAARQGAAGARRRPERLLHERVREHVRALRRRRRQARPGADASAPRGRRESRRRRVPLPLDRGREPGLPPHPARARRADRRHERPRARPRQRTARARPAPARARRRPERELLHRARNPTRSRAETIELLASHGADVDRPGGETWRGDVPAPDAVSARRAPRKGRTGASCSPELGASTELIRLTPRSPRSPRRAPAGSAAGLARPRRAGGAVLSALRGGLDRVRRRRRAELQRCRRRLAGRDAAPPRLLGRLAGRRGAPARARRRPRRTVSRDFERPLDWVIHASQYYGLSDRDYVGIAERLVAAGAPLEARYPEVAEGPLADWLQRMSIASPKE